MSMQTRVYYYTVDKIKKKKTKDRFRKLKTDDKYDIKKPFGIEQTGEQTANLTGSQKQKKKTRIQNFTAG